MPGKVEISSKLVPSPRNRINDTLEISEAGVAKFQASNLFNINMNRALVFHTWKHYDKLSLFIYISDNYRRRKFTKNLWTLEMERKLPTSVEKGSKQRAW